VKKPKLNLPDPAAVFQTTLLDPSGLPNLVFGSSQPNQLNWRLKNNATSPGQDLVITPFKSGQTSPTQYHFSFNFAPGALTAAPSIPGWSVAVQSDSQGAIQSAYLAADTLITIAPQGSNLADWTYTTAIQEDSNNSQVAVTITAGQNVTLGGVSIEGKTYGPIDLTLVPAGTPPLSAAPISVDFVGRRTVLNDGKTRNSFTFALTNMTSADLVLMPQPKIDDGSSPSVFTVWFDAAPNDPQQPYAWALAQVQDLDATFVRIAPPSSNWIVTKAVTANALLVAGNPQWALTVSSAVTLPPQSPLLFTFSGIVTDLDPGFTRMYLGFQNLGSFASGVLIAELEKSPLLYGSTRGQGFFLSGGKYTGPTLPVLNFDSGLFVQQYESKPSATLSGGTGLRVEGTQGPAATIKGGIVVDVGNQAIQGLTVSSNNAASTLSVAQAGTGPALQVQGPTSLQSVTVNNAETVQGLLTANAGAVVNGVGTVLRINGDSVLSGNVQVIRTATVSELLTANGGFAANGQVTGSGPYAVIGGYQGKSFGTPYTAPTDGIVVACCYWSSNAGMCSTRLWGYVNGTVVAMCNGGNQGTFKVNSPSDWSSVLTMNPNTITFPVPRGSSWQVNINPDSWNQVQIVGATLYFVPFGTAQLSGREVHQPEPGELVSSAARRQESNLQDSIYDLIDELGKALGKSFPESAREALAERIHKLVQIQTPDDADSR
jgi:hypothetical protein